MASVVDSMPRRPRRAGRYPWHQWLDGRVWALRRGEDFDCIPRAMQSMAAQYGRRSGLRVSTRAVGDVVYVQAKRD